MNFTSWATKLKAKWGITSNWQFFVILLVFSLTGSSAVFVRKPIFQWCGITSETPFWITVPLYIVTVLPAYQVLLIFYGTLLGQFSFFWNMEKKMISGMGRLIGIKPAKNPQNQESN